ncbi:MAG: hypothetical protein ACRD2N_19535 [Vicinamibacterales bacterium]
MTLRASLVATIATVSGVGRQRAPEQRTYQVHGQVLVVPKDSRKILVKHDDIPGFMPAMPMPDANHWTAAQIVADIRRALAS